MIRKSKYGVQAALGPRVLVDTCSLANETAGPAKADGVPSWQEVVCAHGDFLVYSNDMNADCLQFTELIAMDVELTRTGIAGRRCELPGGLGLGNLGAIPRCAG
jgi:hypothetical protein